MGLPRLLPPALRLRPAALRAPALPHAAHAARRRAPARPRRDLAPRGRLRRCSTRRRSSPGARRRSRFGRIPALFTRAAAARLPGVRDALPPGLERRRLRHRARGLGAAPRARDATRPSGWRFAALGAGIAVLVLIRPANQVAAPARARAAARARRLAAPARLVGGVRRWRRSLPLAAWALHNGVRYDDATVARGGRAWVPFLHVFTGEQDDLAGERRARRGGSRELIEERGARERRRTRASTSRSTRTSQNGSNYETVRLIALSDRVLGRDENYDVLFDSARRGHPRASGDVLPRRRATRSGSSSSQRPLREDVAPREQTAPERPPPTFESDGVVLPNPQAHVLVDGVPVRLRLVRVRLHRLVHARRSVARSGTTRRRRSAIARSSRRSARGTPSFRPVTGVDFVPEILNRITPRFPRPPLWLAVGLVALVVRRPRGWRTIVVLWAARVPRAPRSMPPRRASLRSSRCRSTRSSS